MTKSNVMGGPVDGGWIDPPSDNEPILQSERGKTGWALYRWEPDSQRWILHSQYGPMLTRDEP